MESILTFIFVIVILVFSTVLHELAHGFTAYKLGDDTAKLSGRLSLNPLNHIDPMMSIVVPAVLFLMGGPIFGGAKPVPINTNKVKGGEWGFALVAIAGPLTNIVLSFLFFLLWFFTGQNADFWGTIASYGMFINMGFALFNILPIPPLDGSRVLYALAPDFARNVLRAMEPYGLVVVYIVVFLLGGWFSNYMAGAQSGLLSAYFWLVGVR